MTGAEAVAHEREVAAQLVRVGVARLGALRAQRVVEPVLDEAELVDVSDHEKKYARIFHKILRIFQLVTAVVNFS